MALNGNERKASIKVIRIITRLNIGGPALHAILMSKQMERLGYETKLIVGSSEEGEGDLRSLARAQGLELIYIPQLHRRISFWDDLVAFFKLWRIIQSLRPDIVCTHTAKAGALGRLAAWLSGVRVRVHTFHGHIFHSYFSRWKTRMFLMAERFLALLTHCVFVISNTQATELTEKFRVVSKGKVRTVHLGLELEPFLNGDRFPRVFRLELGVDPSVFLVGIVGRLVPVKNHLMFLEAARLVAQKLEKTGQKILFLVIGDGELRADLENRAALLGLKGLVRFLGWRKELEWVYSDLDLVVLTSLNEGTPVAVIEAMAAGVPVISTDVGGVRDVVRSGMGLLVESGDACGLSDSILSLMWDPNRRHIMGHRGREFVRERFSKDRLLTEMDAYYRGLLYRVHGTKSVRVQTEQVKVQ